jgi:capsule polysaccharide export protein KpsE/RkpR
VNLDGESLTEISVSTEERALSVATGSDAPIRNSPEYDAGKPLVERLRLLLTHRSFIFRVALVGLFAFALVVFLIPTRYESTTRLMPPDQNASPGLAMAAAMAGQAAGSLGALAGDVLGMKTSGALFVGVLGSRTVASRLVDRFDLKKVYDVHRQGDAIQRLEERTAISEDRKSGIIAITVTDHSPQRAAQLAQAYVEELDRLVSQLSTSSARRERIFLEDRLKGVKADLDDAAERFGQFASKNTAIDIQAQGKAMVDAASQLQGEMIAAESQLQGLRQIYTDSNVRVREIEARIGELQRQLDKLGGSGTASVKNTLSADDPSYPTIRELPLLGVTYADLYRRTKIEEVIFQTLTQQYELAKVQEAKETPSVKVLDQAVIPEKKSFPPRLEFMLMGTLATMMLAVFSVFVMTAWKEADPRDARKLLAEEVFRTAQAGIARALPMAMRWTARGLGHRKE